MGFGLPLCWPLESAVLRVVSKTCQSFEPSLLKAQQTRYILHPKMAKVATFFLSDKEQGTLKGTLVHGNLRHPHQSYPPPINKALLYKGLLNIRFP